MISLTSNSIPTIGSENENTALASLITMLLRCCACNESVDGDTAVDYDGVVDRLDDVAEGMKKVSFRTSEARNEVFLNEWRGGWFFEWSEEDERGR